MYNVLFRLSGKNYIMPWVLKTGRFIQPVYNIYHEFFSPHRQEELWLHTCLSFRVSLHCSKHSQSMMLYLTLSKQIWVELGLKLDTVVGYPQLISTGTNVQQTHRRFYYIVCKWGCYSTVKVPCCAIQSLGTPKKKLPKLPSDLRQIQMLPLFYY